MSILNREQQICAGAKDDIASVGRVSRQVLIDTATTDCVVIELGREDIVHTEGSVRLPALAESLLHLHPASNIIEGMIVIVSGYRVFAGDVILVAASAKAAKCRPTVETSAELET